jgi:hypothetical protein
VVAEVEGDPRLADRRHLARFFDEAVDDFRPGAQLRQQHLDRRASQLELREVRRPCRARQLPYELIAPHAATTTGSSSQQAPTRTPLVKPTKLQQIH